MLDALLDGLRFVARLVMFHDEQFNFMGPFREIARRDGASSEFQRCDEEQVLRAFLSAPNDALNSPLHAACATGSPKSVRWLLKHGADQHVLNLLGKDPVNLLISTCDARERAVAAVDDATLKVLDKDFERDKDLGAYTSGKECMEILLEDGRFTKNGFVSDCNACFPLYHAARAGTLDVVKLLLKHGASPFDRISFEMERKAKEWDDACSKGGSRGGKKLNPFRTPSSRSKRTIDTASDVAKSRGHTAIVDLLDSAMEAQTMSTFDKSLALFDDEPKKKKKKQKKLTGSQRKKLATEEGAEEAQEGSESEPEKEDKPDNVKEPEPEPAPEPKPEPEPEPKPEPEPEPESATPSKMAKDDNGESPPSVLDGREASDETSTGTTQTALDLADEIIPRQLVDYAVEHSPFASAKEDVEDEDTPSAATVLRRKRSGRTKAGTKPKDDMPERNARKRQVDADKASAQPGSILDRNGAYSQSTAPAAPIEQHSGRVAEEEEPAWASVDVPKQLMQHHEMVMPAQQQSEQQRESQEELHQSKSRLNQWRGDGSIWSHIPQAVHSSVGAPSPPPRSAAATMPDWDREIFTTDIDADWDALGWVARASRRMEAVHLEACASGVGCGHVLGIDLEHLSFGQLDAVEEVHRELLARITDARIALARRQERAAVIEEMTIASNKKEFTTLAQFERRL